MLLRSLNQLFQDPLYLLLTLVAISVALLIAITIHEFSHALVAYGLGDSTAKRLGRLSLNPAAHLDPMGTAMLFLAGFGWGKPVPVNPMYLRSTGRQGMAMVSLAGPLSNVMTAGLFAIPIRAGLMSWHSPFRLFVFRGGPEDLLADLFGFIIFYNLILAAFNLIPLAPLDGFKVALGILPREMAASFARLETYGPAILLSVIMVDIFLGLGILGAIIGPAVNFLGRVVLGQQAIL